MANETEIQSFTSERQPAFRSDIFVSDAGAEVAFAVLVDTLVEANRNDPLTNWIVRGARDRNKAMRAYFEWLTNEALPGDGVIAANDGSGVALVVQPGTEREEPPAVTKQKIMGISAWPGIKEAFDDLAALRPADAAYLTAFGIRPGSSCAVPLLRGARARAPERPLVLEVSREGDLPFFQENGFAVLGQPQLFRAPKVWTLRAAPLDT